jgi:hypothetical protein
MISIQMDTDLFLENIFVVSRQPSARRPIALRGPWPETDGG